MVERAGYDAGTVEAADAALNVGDREGVVGPGVVRGGGVCEGVVEERGEHPDVDDGVLGAGEEDSVVGGEAQDGDLFVVCVECPVQDSCCDLQGYRGSSGITESMKKRARVSLIFHDRLDVSDTSAILGYVTSQI